MCSTVFDDRDNIHVTSRVSSVGWRKITKTVKMLRYAVKK